MKKTVNLYTERIVNGAVVSGYQEFTEKEYKKLLKSCQKQSKSNQKNINIKKK